MVHVYYINHYTYFLVGIDPPNNVEATVLAPKIIGVSWDPIESTEVTGYLITYTTAAAYARGNNVTVYGHNVSKVLLKNLEENTLYSITVQSISANKVSGPSNVVSAVTWSTGQCIRVMFIYTYTHIT